MKIGILTWYKALNHGAVLQTYASCKLLEETGVTPVVLDFHWNIDSRSGVSGKLKRIVKKFSISQIVGHFRVKHALIEKRTVFQQFVNKKIPLGQDYSQETNLDAVYIGSDMVFDFSQGYNPFMYGKDVPCDFIFSYAASFGYTTIEKMEQSEHKDEIIDALKRFKAIGYRDKNTLDIINRYDINVPTFECIDPVLCYGFEKEIEDWDKGQWKDKHYIVIYAYDSTMNDAATIKRIKGIADDEGLEIISCGYYHKWCDKCVQASPDEFVEMIKHAKFVITDTFHGTVFATIMHKNFVSIIRTNGFKLKYFLEQSGLGDRISDTEHPIEAVLHSNPDYHAFDNWLRKEREKSKMFIQSNIDEVRG